MEDDVLMMFISNTLLLQCCDVNANIDNSHILRLVIQIRRTSGIPDHYIQVAVESEQELIYKGIE